jgi:hypothetical protein
MGAPVPLFLQDVDQPMQFRQPHVDITVVHAPEFEQEWDIETEGEFPCILFFEKNKDPPLYCMSQA